jgi:rhodanese-related sulfurtransferase
MSIFRSWLLIAGLATALAVADAALNPRARTVVLAGGPPDEITLTAARAHHGPLLWIDARTDAEFSSDHIPEALPLNADHWDAQVAQVLRNWQPGTWVIVYCSQSGCGASRNVADRLRRDYRLPDVWVLRGGWAAWEKAVAR